MSDSERCPRCGKPSVDPPAEIYCVDCATRSWWTDAKRWRLPDEAIEYGAKMVAEAPYDSVTNDEVIRIGIVSTLNWLQDHGWHIEDMRGHPFENYLKAGNELAEIALAYVHYEAHSGEVLRAIHSWRELTKEPE